jgi:hypothetical protein
MFANINYGNHHLLSPAKLAGFFSERPATISQRADVPALPLESIRGKMPDIAGVWRRGNVISF